ncbi:mechanosensitive ion channel family protein [Halogeometricum sp. S1BR25-6]|uniref:Mechanosensitive ion channel family protein n=1 Tax=Halogeometricum salsisoli TaxID=2950536 RepID=A0ABU2GCL2_9EURY|nr:mechanosensitive ion channel family protein [Halogeometricum sp. S1BR25-6]MDS0298550.1 mechanosensitive ion channel family protein [Halogeometricum sp. S1BR25-6]
MLGPFTDAFAGLSAVEATAALLLVSVAAALALEFVVLRTARRYVVHTDSAYDDIVLSELRAPLVVTAALAGVLLLTQVPSVRASTVFPPATLDTFFGKPSVSVIVLVWAYAANRAVNRLVERVNEEGGRFDFAPVLSNVWTLVVLLGGAATLLYVWNIEITPLLGAAGVAGIAVGFAAKDTVANFFGGIALYFDDTYKLGDFIVLDDGTSGSVVKVGIRSTTLLTRDELMVTVPNSVLNAAKITNESAPQRRRRIRVPLSVAYGTELDGFEALAVDVAEAESLVLDSPKPRMRFRRFGDSALEYELLCWVSAPTRRRRAQHELNRALYAALNDAAIEIPFPKRDVTLTTTAAADVESTGRVSDPSGTDPEGDGRVATDGAGETGGADADVSPKR